MSLALEAPSAKPPTPGGKIRGLEAPSARPPTPGGKIRGLEAPSAQPPTPGRKIRAALVVPFADLSSAVDDWRERTCLSKPSHRVPPHVTLLVPCPAEVAAIGDVLAPFPAFDVGFASLDRFPGTLWLAPEPAEPFRRMTEAVVARFPDHPPYEGAFRQVIPHLTVAQSDLDAAAEELERRLPLRSRAASAVLLEAVEPDRWLELASFELEAR